MRLEKRKIDEEAQQQFHMHSLLSSILMTFLVFHFDTISCSIEFHFQIHSSTFEHSHSRLIDSINFFFFHSLYVFFRMKRNITRHYRCWVSEGWGTYVECISLWLGRNLSSPHSHPRFVVVWCSQHFNISKYSRFVIFWMLSCYQGIWENVKRKHWSKECIVIVRLMNLQKLVMVKWNF